ncbi:glutamine amidotransferase, partial [Pseudoalteromonas maricaloris]
YPHLKVLKDTRFVMDQNFTSSAGISAGIDMSLELVKLHFGKKLAEKTARQMDYNWL